MAILLGTTSCILLGLSLVLLALFTVDLTKLKKKKKNLLLHLEDLVLVDPPGPKPWPILGSLLILGKYDVPYKAFGYLRDTFDSNVVKMRVGSTPCIVVNGLENIKEVLYTKGQYFDSRPDFTRFQVLFHGNKDNSLAFCDWSDVQRIRREMLKVHTFPRAFSSKFVQLNDIINTEMSTFMDYLLDTKGTKFHVKPLLLQACGNVFTNYFCSKRFDASHQPFADMISNFDKVFYEVNVGCPSDFIPGILPLFFMKTRNMKKWSTDIRSFVNEYIIQDRFDNWNGVLPEEDYVDCLINYVKFGEQPEMTWDTSLFALEDIIGGHSAIGNFLMKVLGFLVTRPQIQKIAQQEIDQVHVTSNVIGLEQRGSMPYVEAIILECIRLIASPIVPHVANQNTSIAGFRVEKGNLVFLNNYDLNMSDKLWMKPNEFMPERFIQNGRISKPEHFLPFGGGRRSCMGYKLVHYVSFSALASILKNFTILPAENENYEIPIGHLAMKENCFSLRFEQR